MATASDSLLRLLLRQGESETVEFKESFGREALETLCAFANTNGGLLLIGINDKGDIKGIPGGANTLKDLANQIAQTTGLHPSIKTMHSNNKRIIHIRVPKSRIRPVLYHGKAYSRSGSTTCRMGMDEITKTVLTSVGMTWDEMPEVRANIADISTTKIKAFIRMANEQGRRPIPSRINPLELLHKLKLLRQGRPTRAAVLLFGKHPQDFYAQSIIKVGRFRGKTLVVDDREIAGTLFDQIEGAMLYFREKLDTRFEMTGMPQRKVVWEYPLDALREAVTNAVCHREYMSTAQTQARIYDHELLVMNPGGLPTALSVDSIKKAHHSVPRNRQIAEILFYAGLIEAWGSGIEKMMDECANAGLPKPVFESDQAFKVAFKKAALTSTPQAPHKHPSSTDQVPTKYRLSTDQVPTKYRPSTGQVLRPEIWNLLAYCRQPKRIRQIMAHLGLSHKYTFTTNYLRPLLAQGLLAMTTPDSPRSPKQSYVATPQGLTHLRKMNWVFRPKRR